MKALIDSDVLIDYLSGEQKAQKEIEQYRNPQISAVSWVEVLSGAADEQDEQICIKFLSSFTTVDVTPEVAKEAVMLRKKFKLKTPDAIIWACATTSGSVLVTRNSRDFPRTDPRVRIPYRLEA